MFDFTTMLYILQVEYHAYNQEVGAGGGSKVASYVESRFHKLFFISFHRLPAS